MLGFFMSMNENVDIFSEKVKADINLSHGFNCIGLSQGNNICRGYIQKYNDPPVNTHLSIHGPVGGVSALPHCYPDSSYVGETCQEISDLLSKFAYNSIIQDFLFQADYFRDINYINNTLYKHNSQIGNWNQEGYQYNTEYKINFNKTNKYAMIKANNDTVVVPRESEWWGTYDTDYTTILTMKDTLWYKNDMFGLRTADENNKIIFNSTNGNHLDFTDEELYGWLDLYC
jgi:palmitoyl-protein thioesterase